MYLTKEKITKLIEENEFIVRPLLNKDKQIGAMSLDLRLGTDFLVSFLGREPYIDVSKSSFDRPIRNFFAPTRRKVGETFILHPHQTVLCSSLEYIRFPNNIGADLFMRSSYTRLGLSLSTMIQAGYCGCLSIELTNTNNNPVQLRVGARIFQAKLFKLDTETNYDYPNRKYVCQVRPEVSKANLDLELDILDKFYKGSSIKEENTYIEDILEEEE